MVDHLFLGPQTNPKGEVAVVSATIRKGHAIPMHDSSRHALANEKKEKSHFPLRRNKNRRLR
jgi:hypothetical protein